jgi:hypothetical protein
MSNNNNVNIGTKELGAIADDEEDNPSEVIGFLKFSTTGEVLVPREWLLEQWENHNLPKRLLPTETTNWQAYRRTIRYLQEQSEYLGYEAFNEHYNRSFDCELNIEKSNEHGSNVFLIYARTFLPEEICGEDGGNWNEQRVGMFDFHRPDNDNLPGRMVTRREIDEDNAHYEQLTKLFQSAREVEQKMQSHHNYNDLQNMLDGFRDVIANAVEIRRSVYFVPAHHQDALDGLANVWRGMNQFKDNGEAMRIDKTPVVDMQEQRELVASRVREKLDDTVSQVIRNVFADWEDETADEIANRILNDFGEEGVGDTQSTYNQLLNVRLSIKDLLEDMQNDVDEEKEEVIENVLNQETLDNL